MTTIEQIFRESANFLIGGKRGAQARIARETGIPASYVSAILSGAKPGTDEARRKVAAALGYPGDRYEAFLNIGRNILAKRDPFSGGPATPSDEDLAAQGFMKVDFSDNMKLAAGGGGRIEVTEPAENSKVIVHRASLGRGTYRPKQLQAFRVGGDSMEPIIAKGGIVLADITPREKDPRNIKEGAIYVLCWDLRDGECALKYLRWAKKGRLLSIESEDSKRFKPVFREIDEVQLVGRVIWAWREF